MACWWMLHGLELRYLLLSGISSSGWIALIRHMAATPSHSSFLPISTNLIHPAASVDLKVPRDDLFLTRFRPSIKPCKPRAMSLAWSYHSLTTLASAPTFPDCSHYLVELSVRRLARPRCAPKMTPPPNRRARCRFVWTPQYLSTGSFYPKLG
jgi:hypothetical protein